MAAIVAADNLGDLEPDMKITVRGWGWTVQATVTQQQDGWLRARKQDGQTAIVSAEAIKTGLYKVETGWPE